MQEIWDYSLNFQNQTLLDGPDINLNILPKTNSDSAQMERHLMDLISFISCSVAAT